MGTGTHHIVRTLAERYAYPEPLTKPWVRVNFVSSVDGAVEIDGRTAGLGSPGDQHVFQLLRELADVVLVGAGTVRAEGYGGLGLSPAAQDRRRGRGLSSVPALAIVTSSANLQPTAPVFTETDGSPLVITTSGAPEIRRQQLRDAGAEVVTVGDKLVPVDRMLAELDRRGLRRVLCEGGPRLFGELAAADAVDELCLTIAPCLAGPGAARIIGGPTLTAPVTLRLTNMLAEDGVLLLTYTRE